MDPERLGRINKISKEKALRAFLLAILLPVIAIALNRHSGNLHSILGFLKIHNTHPYIYFLEILPFIVYYYSYRYKMMEETGKNYYEREIDQLDQTIKRNAKIAQMIGEKEFTFPLDEIPKTDTLGQALLLMRNNLLKTNRKEEELNWMTRGKDLISSVLRQHNSIDVLSYETLTSLISYIGAVQGSFFLFEEDKKNLVNIASYAYNRRKYVNQEFKIGIGLIGQAAFEMEIIYRKEIPDDYFSITSGILGEKKPKTLLIVPLIGDEKLQGIIEFGSFATDIPDLTIKLLKELGTIIGQTIFNLKVNTKTERLLKEAQKLTEELKHNEEELRKNAVDMQITQEELEKSNSNLEAQVFEVENAQKRLHSLLENASEVISIYDEMGVAKYVSPSVKHILGYSPSDVVGKNAFEEVHYESSKLKQIFYELLEHPDNPRTVEYSYERAPGNVTWLETTGRNLLNNQAINGIIFNTRDITLRKIAERAQRMSGRMQALSENSIDMIIRLGLNSKFVYVNPVVERYTGIIVNDFLNKNIFDVNIDSNTANLFDEILKLIVEKQENFQTETNFISSFGIRIMQVNAIPEFNDENELESILIVSHDITEQKSIEQELITKNKSINDSINYAQRIQTAILPDNRLIREYLPQSFIFYKPRDIVSGDFPWFFAKNETIYIAAVDCTGHGVPGAMLSFIGYFLLNNIADHDNGMTAGQILDELNEGVRKTMKQDRNDSSARDGMDIAFCKIDLKNNILQYAGAHRPLIHQRAKELTVYKGFPDSIGGIQTKLRDNDGFETHTMTLEKKDRIFFFSDGITDQIGGPKGKKYQISRIREILIERSEDTISDLSMFFTKDFNNWKGENKQIDDVLLIGIEF